MDVSLWPLTQTPSSSWNEVDPFPLENVRSCCSYPKYCTVICNKWKGSGSVSCSIRDSRWHIRCEPVKPMAFCFPDLQRCICAAFTLTLVPSGTLLSFFEGWMHRTVRSPISVCWACQSTLSVQFEQSGPGAMYSSGHLNIPAVAKWHQT